MIQFLPFQYTFDSSYNSPFVALIAERRPEGSYLCTSFAPPGPACSGWFEKAVVVAKGQQGIRKRAVRLGGLGAAFIRQSAHQTFMCNRTP